LFDSSTLDVLIVMATYGLFVEDVAWQIVTLSDGVALTLGITIRALTPIAPMRPMEAAIPQRARCTELEPEGLWLLLDIEAPRRR
jgi:hypothetical protein